MDLLEDSPLQLILLFGNLLFALSAFLFFMYLVQVQSFRSRTKKYKFVSEKESQAMRGTAILLSSSIGFYVLVLVALSLGPNGAFHYILAGLVAIAAGYALGKGLLSYLSYYHPFILEKRLKDIRFGPMKSPVNGMPMTLLTESQEDVHLSKEMIEEEDSLAVDYDVWVDDASDYKVIERYDTRFHPFLCAHCNFKTLTERKSEIIEEPGEHEKGLLRKFYECTYCGHIESRDIDISSWAEEQKFDHYEKDLVEIPDAKKKA